MIYPKNNSFTQIYGDTQSGKNFLLYHYLKHFNDYSLFLDLEHKFDPEYVKSLGVNLGDIIYRQTFDINSIKFLLSAKVGLSVIIIDSIIAMDQDKLRENLLQLKILSKKYPVKIIFTNQIRSKLHKTDKAGGKFIKFYSDIILKTQRLHKVKEGREISITVEKSNIGDLNKTFKLVIPIKEK